MTHDASHSYTYDAENRITKVDGGSTATYGYDADGRRASGVVAGVETDYIYDLSGHVVADYGGGCGATCWRVGYVYLNGQVLAEYFGGTYFVHTDHLGSTRLLTNYPTPTVAECDDYYPFGEQASCGGTSTTTHKFTGYERDSETGLDNARARYNSSTLGRFMSPDPIGNFVADATNPQTWNMYAYVNNNPLTMTDPSGMDYGCNLSWDNPCGGFDYGWEGDFGFGTSYTMDGAQVPASVATAALDSGVGCLWSCTTTVMNNGKPYQYVQTAGPTVVEGPNGEELSASSIAEAGLPSLGDSQTPTPTGTQLDENSCAARLANGVQNGTGFTTSNPQFTTTHGGHANYSFTVADPTAFQSVLNQNQPWSLPFGLDTGHRYGLINSTHILDPATQGCRAPR